jgi:hypothetical protein
MLLIYYLKKPPARRLEAKTPLATAKFAGEGEKRG